MMKVHGYIDKKIKDLQEHLEMHGKMKTRQTLGLEARIKNLEDKVEHLQNKVIVLDGRSRRVMMKS